MTRAYIARAAIERLESLPENHPARPSIEAAMLEFATESERRLRAAQAKRERRAAKRSGE